MMMGSLTPGMETACLALATSQWQVLEASFETALFDARRSAMKNKCMGAGSAVHRYGGVNGKVAQVELVQSYIASL